MCPFWPQHGDKTVAKKAAPACEAGSAVSVTSRLSQTVGAFADRCSAANTLEQPLMSVSCKWDLANKGPRGVGYC